MEDTELSPSLRQAYDGADAEMEPSPFLRERTLRALRDRGIVGPVASRKPGRMVAVAVAAAAVGFLLGWQVSGTGDAARGWTTPTSLEAALEEVQGTGTAHARALERLVESLDRVDAATLSGAQEVYLAAERARLAYSRILLAGRAAGADHEPIPALPVAGSLIWF